MDITKMPRTKQIRKMSSMKRGYQKVSVSSNSASDSPPSRTNRMLKAKEYASKDHVAEEFRMYINEDREKRIGAYKRSQEYIKTIIKGIKEGSAQFLHLDVDDDRIENCCKDENKDPNITVPANEEQMKSSPSRKFEFVRPRAPTTNSVRKISRKRSLSASSASSASTGPPEPFKTPFSSSTTRLQAAGTITPKIYSDTPMTVMRHPACGELAVSMSGSPLMVGSFSRADIPTVNVPMNDGRIFSIMPEPGAPPPDLPDFDETTKNYLKTLRAHLEFLAPSPP